MTTLSSPSSLKAEVNDREAYLRRLREERSVASEKSASPERTNKMANISTDARSVMSKLQMSLEGLIRSQHKQLTLLDEVAEIANGAAPPDVDTGASPTRIRRALMDRQAKLFSDLVTTQRTQLETTTLFELGETHAKGAVAGSVSEESLPMSIRDELERLTRMQQQHLNHLSSAAASPGAFFQPQSPEWHAAIAQVSDINQQTYKLHQDAKVWRARNREEASRRSDLSVVEAHREDVEDVEIQLRKLQDKSGALFTDVSVALQHANAARSADNKQVGLMQRIIEELNNENQSLSKRTTQLVNEKEDGTRRVAALNDETTLLRDACSRHESELDGYKAKIAKLEEKLDLKQLELDECQQTNKVLHSELDVLKTYKETMRVESAREVGAATEASRQHNERELTASRYRLKVTSDELADAQRDHRVARREADGLRNELRLSQRTVESLRGQVITLESNLEHSRERERQLSAVNKRLETHVRDQHQQLAASIAMPRIGSMASSKPTKVGSGGVEHSGGGGTGGLVETPRFNLSREDSNAAASSALAEAKSYLLSVGGAASGRAAADKGDDSGHITPLRGSSTSRRQADRGSTALVPSRTAADESKLSALSGTIRESIMTREHRLKDVGQRVARMESEAEKLEVQRTALLAKRQAAKTTIVAQRNEMLLANAPSEDVAKLSDELRDVLIRIDDTVKTMESNLAVLASRMGSARSERDTLQREIEQLRVREDAISAELIGK